MAGSQNKPLGQRALPQSLCQRRHGALGAAPRARVGRDAHAVVELREPGRVLRDAQLLVGLPARRVRARARALVRDDRVDRGRHKL